MTIQSTGQDWVDLRRDPATGIETIRAHFEGHAYDPHWHDSYLVGVTEQGVQQFHCGKAKNISTPGRVFLVEPGEIHDGLAPAEGGFTYRMLYIDPAVLAAGLTRIGCYTTDGETPYFARTLFDDPTLAAATYEAVGALHTNDIRLVQDAAFDRLLRLLARHSGKRAERVPDIAPIAAQRAREFLHAHFDDDVGLDALAAAAGTSRYKLSRAFKSAYGLPPHAYLVQLRLTYARRRLAAGDTAVDVAAACGFADQSHLGRWFQRAYRLSPAAYQQRCTNLPD